MKTRRRFFRRRPARKRSYKPRVARKKSIKKKMAVHHFKRSKIYTQVFSDNLTDTFGQWYFGLSDLPSYTEFTTLYDQYRINFIVLKFYPRITQINLPQSSTTAPVVKIPNMFMVVDHDGGTTVTSFDQLLQYPKCKIAPMNRGFTLKFRPASLSTMYADAVTSNYSPKWKQWCDVTQPQQRHYGVQYGIETHLVSGAPADNMFGYDVHLHMYFSCRGVR